MISILIIIIGIGGLIFVHELGHFTVAKWSGVKVEVFSVGFGWKLLSYQIGETQYALSAIPLGGYVKMAGELPNEERTGADYELHSKSAWKRFWIFSAGSLMNLLIIFPVCVFMFWVGVDRAGNRVGHVRSGSPEWKVGVRPGQKLVGFRVQKQPGPVNDTSNVEWGPLTEVDSLEQYRETLLGLAEEQHVKVRFASGDGNGDVKEYVIDPDDPMDAQNVIPYSNVVRGVINRSPAAKAGIRPNDQLISVNGRSIHALPDVRHAINSHVNPRLRYLVERADGGKELHEVAVPQGVPYLLTVDGKRFPVYRLSDDLNLRDRLNLAEDDRIVRINDVSPSPGSDGPASAVYDGKLNLSDVSLTRAPTGPVSVRVKREVKKNERRVETTKTFSLYPDVSMQPEPRTGLLVKPVIDAVQQGSPADQAGLKSGDRILAINGQSVPRQYHLNLWLEDRAGEEVSLTYRRDGRKEQVAVVPEEGRFGGGEIGVTISTNRAPAPLPSLSKHSGFARSGFRKGDVIVAFYTSDGTRKGLTKSEYNKGKESDDKWAKADVKGVQQLQRFLNQRDSDGDLPDRVTVDVRRTVDGTETTQKMTYKPNKQRSGLIGVGLRSETFSKRYGFVEGITAGIRRGVDLYDLTFLGIKKMFQDEEAAKKGLAGPVRIFSLSYRAVQQDFGQFLKILALISISLGILNLLPIPPLDGGHILFLFIEVLRGKPLSEDVLYKIQLIGFLFFILLFIVITYNDFVNILN